MPASLGGRRAEKRAARGFTLLETLCALAAGSLLLTAALRLLPPLHRNSQGAMQQLRLMRQLDLTALTIARDLRRAGFCRPPCAWPAVQIGEIPGEPVGSCLLVGYAFFAGGGQGPSGALINDRFGFRLRRGALETQRGVRHCDGPGWEKLHDSDWLVITRLRFALLSGGAVRLTLAGALRDQPDIGYALTQVVARRNP